MNKYIYDEAGLFRIDFKDDGSKFKLTLITANSDGTVTSHENDHYYNSYITLFRKEKFQAIDDESAMLYYETVDK